MNARRGVFAAAGLGAILASSALVASGDEQLLRVWSAPRAYIRERAAAVNRSFTNGTPVTAVVAMLGTNYMPWHSSTAWPGPGPEPPKTSGLKYLFGEDYVIVHTTADPNADPLTGRFIRASAHLPHRAWSSQRDAAAHVASQLAQKQADRPRRPPPVAGRAVGRKARMSIEDIQSRAWSVVWLYPWIAPYLLISAVICLRFRREQWIAPFWVFSVGPVVVILGLLLQLMICTGSGGSGDPDWGFVGMGTMFIFLFSLWEVIPGIFLVLCYPRKDAWSKRALLPCILAAAVSFSGCLFAIPHLPKGPLG
jgi:hypothetical protein